MTVEQEVSSTLEDYLEAILTLSTRNGSARVGDIATEVSVHKSTVTAALKTLTDKGLVDYAPYEAARLTTTGRRIAERVTRDHAAIRAFLKDVLLVDDKAAEENACRMEHVMDADVLERLAAFAQALRDCPHSTEQCFRKYLRENALRNNGDSDSPS